MACAEETDGVNGSRPMSQDISEPPAFDEQWTGDDIKLWARTVREILRQNQSVSIKEYLVEIIRVINHAIKITKGFHLRDTQKLSIAMFLRNDRGMLQQISTGEGKTLIIAALCIVKALSGDKVDVITSSSVLAERDAQENCELYDLFDVTVGHICSDSEDERKNVYIESEVVFGEIGSFQRDELMDGFYDKELGIGSRKKGFVIVDEVDSMLLDKAQNVLYLSHCIPGMDALEDAYVNIWNFVHGKDMVGTDDDINAVRECMLSAIYGTLRKQDIDDIFDELEIAGETTDVWKNLVNKRILDERGIILVKDKLKRNELGVQDMGSTEQTVNEVILCRLKDKVREGIFIPMPKYLLSFVDLHLNDWIQNAFRARWMVQNDNYIIDIDRSDAATDLAPNIIIIDKDTGVEQYHSQWSNGLHQFLQLKHGCRLSYEGLKAVFMSNVSFFTQYDGRLYGLTGTLGSIRERDLLKEMYNVDYATVPSFRPSRFIAKLAKICASSEEWMREIIDTSHHICKSECRPVLIICESVHDVEKLETSFAESNVKGIEVHVYKRSYEPLDVGCDSPIDHSCIILATNLAGRGTDIKISDKIDEAGGLHVCLTYLPPSYRVEEQAFGRAARKGQKGSGQLIYQATDDQQMETNQRGIPAIIEHKVKRDVGEEQKIDMIKTHYECTIKQEEKLFETFRRAYRSLKERLRKKKFGKTREKIVLQSCLDEWALWLDASSIPPDESHVSKLDINNFLAEMKDAGGGELGTRFIRSLAQRIKLAKEFTDRKEYHKAEKIFDQVIDEDENFSAAAHYYKCHCIIKRSKGLANNQDKNLLFHHLHKAETLFKAQAEKFANFTSIVQYIGEAYKVGRTSFLLANDFAKQKEDTIQIYSSFIRSIQDIAGHEVSTDALESCLMNPVLAQHAMDALLKKNILTTARVSRPSSEQHHIMRDTYQLSYRHLNEVLVQHENKSVTSDTFRNILPSREEFWQLMINAGYFVDEKIFVVLDKGELDKAFITKDIFSKYKDEMCNMKRCDESERLVTLESETKEAGELVEIPLDEFKEKFGRLEIWKSLMEKGILKVKRKGRFLAGRKARLEKYDGLNEDVFAEEIDGVDGDMSREIFKSLQTNEVISSDGATARLLVDRVTADSVNLKIHRQFETEILNVIAKNFKYRQVLNQLLKGGQIELESEPHKNVYNDLVAAHVIEPVKVCQKMTESQVKENVSSFTGAFCYRELTDICKIGGGVDPRALWQYLFHAGWLKKKQGKQEGTFGYICEDLCHRTLPKPFKYVEPALKIYLTCALAIEAKKDTLLSQIHKWKSGLFTYKNADSNLIPIVDQFDLESVGRLAEEFAILQSNGMFEIISLSERKWTPWAMFKTVAIAIIGLAQVALGVLIEVFTVGAATHIAAGLIGEGAGDIMFALECGASGYCTWEAYGKHKLLSVSAAIITAGVGAFFSRGAQCSRYGYKIGGEFMRNMAGKQLIKEAGKKAVVKAAVSRAMKKIVKATAFGLANIGVEQAIKNHLDSALKSLSKYVIGTFDSIAQNYVIKRILKELCRKVGVEKATAILKQINEELYGSSSHASGWHECRNKIRTVLSRVGGAVSDGFLKASKKMGKCGSDKAELLSNVATEISSWLKEKERKKSVSEIKNAVKEFTVRLEQKLYSVNLQTRQLDGIQVTEKDADDFCKEMIKQWRDHMVSVVQQKITSELVQPAMQSLAHNVLAKVGRGIQNVYAELKTSSQRKKLSNLKAKKELLLRETEGSGQTSQEQVDEHFVALVALQKEARDPHLLADIIREGGPAGIHCLQAIAEYYQRPVEVNTIGGDDTMIMPGRFDPSRPAHHGDAVDPIVIDFHVGENASFGHFEHPDSRHKTGESVNYKCLFKAASSQSDHPVTREEIAHIVETHPLIKDRIKKGIHDHFMGKGGMGRVERIQRKQLKVVDVVNVLRRKEHLIMADVTRLKPLMRDRAEKDKQKETSSAFQMEVSQSFAWKVEMIKTSNIIEIHRKSREQMREHPKAPFDFFDCHTELRVDSRYVIWKSNDGSVQGHAGAIRSSLTVESKRTKRSVNSNTEKHLRYCNRGQASFHYERIQATSKARSAQEAGVVALTTHISSLIHPDELRTMEINRSCWSTRLRLDLSKASDRVTYCRGYEREYYKCCLVARKMNNDGSIRGIPSTLPTHLKNDTYLKEVDAGLRGLESSNIKGIGQILRKPAPTYI